MKVRLTGRRVFMGLVSLVLAATLVKVGWDRFKDPPANLKRLIPSFATARVEFKELAARAFTAGKAKDWASAVRALGTIIDQGGYSEDQKRELLFALTEVRRKAGSVAAPDASLLYRIDELTLAVTD
jgi:hypothetical protein